MEGNSLAEGECWVCGRQLAGSRWVKGSNQLKHSGRTVAEALGKLLLFDSQLWWVCFRCYRLVLALDYHTHQSEKQRLALLKLYDTRDQIKEQASHALVEKNLFTTNNAECGTSITNSEPSIARETSDIYMRKHHSGSSEHVDNVKEKLYEIPSSLTYKTDKAVLPYPLQSVYDNEYYRNDDQDKAGKSTALRGYDLSNIGILLDQDCTRSLMSDTCIASGEDGRTKQSSTDGNIFKSQYQENMYSKQKEISTAASHPPPPPPSQRHVLKRRKTAKKWDDFEYYEDESKNVETECDRIDPLPPSHQQYRVPIRTGRKRCQKCKKDFPTKKAILSHNCCQAKGTDHEKVRYKCKGCLHVFLLRREYIRHVNACYKNTPVTCNLCLVKLPSAAYLPRHLAALHQVKSSLNKNDILCELCGRGFSRKEALERHEARVHGKAHGSHQCPLCGHTFPHTSLLAEHLRAHQGYTCPDCSKVFSCRSNLTLHRRAHHLRKAAYHCTACNRHWKFHSSYTYHMKKFHRSNEYKCPRCKLLLYSEEALNQHSVTCGGQNTSNINSSTRHQAHIETRQDTKETVKQTSNTIADSLEINGCHTQLTKETDNLIMVPEVRETEMYDPQNTFRMAPPTCEIVVEVLEEKDADCQYIILVEDIANT